MKITDFKYKIIDSVIIFVVIGLITYLGFNGFMMNFGAMDLLYRPCNNLGNCNSNPGIGLALVAFGMICYAIITTIFLVVTRFDDLSTQVLTVKLSKNKLFRIVVSMFFMLALCALLYDGLIVLHGRNQSYGIAKKGYIAYAIDDVICEKKHIVQTAEVYDVPYDIPESVINNPGCTIKNKFWINYAWRLSSGLLVIFIINYMLLIKKEEWMGYSMIGSPILFFLLTRFLIKIISTIL